MTDIGLWAIARATPDRTAVTDPDGTTVSYAELADRYGRGGPPQGRTPPADRRGPGPGAVDRHLVLGDFLARPPRRPRALCCSPLYHTAVLNFATISVQLGHPVVLMDRFEPEALLALIERHRVTHTHMVPTQFRRLLALPQVTRDRHDVSSLRAVIHSAAPCPQDVKRRMLDWWGPVVIEYYAASEGGGTVITAREWLEQPGSVGRPWPGTEVRVLDTEGNDVPAGQPGLVYLRTAGWPSSSCRRPSTTSRNCRATPTASSTSGACATRTGKAATGPSETCV